jgi:hypothetical protein
MKLSTLLLISALAPAAFSQEIPLKNWDVPGTWKQPADHTTGNPSLHKNGAISTGLLTFVAIAPCRIMDTRQPSYPVGFGTPSLVGQQSRTVVIYQSNCGIPVAAAYSLNFTVVVPPGGTLGFLTAYPDNLTSPPLISTLNASQGGIVGNSAIVPGGTSDGGINVFATNNTDLIIDANGYFIDQVDLSSSTTNLNTAIGVNSLLSNSSGNDNTAFGAGTLRLNVSGSENSAFGYFALASATGFGNIGIGTFGGLNLGGGNFNIDIGNLGANADAGVIRIGNSGSHTSTYIAGISGVSVSGGQLVVVNSRV